MNSFAKNEFCLGVIHFTLRFGKNAIYDKIY